MVIHWCYGMCGTELAYAAMLVLWHELAYAAMGYRVLSYAYAATQCAVLGCAYGVLSCAYGTTRRIMTTTILRPKLSRYQILDTKPQTLDPRP
eukprot:3941937-Rhodomonas_salina.2